MKLDPIAILNFADLVMGMLGKKPKTKKVREALGDLELVDEYLAGCALYQTAADAGLGFGNPADPANYLTPAQVKAISKADDLMVKMAKKVEKALK